MQYARKDTCFPVTRKKKTKKKNKKQKTKKQKNKNKKQKKKNKNKTKTRSKLVTTSEDKTLLQKKGLDNFYCVREEKVLFLSDRETEVT